jgi:hypothetical protein
MNPDLEQIPTQNLNPRDKKKSEMLPVWAVCISSRKKEQTRQFRQVILIKKKFNTDQQSISFPTVPESTRYILFFCKSRLTELCPSQVKEKT